MSKRRQRLVLMERITLTTLAGSAGLIALLMDHVIISVILLVLTAIGIRAAISSWITWKDSVDETIEKKGLEAKEVKDC